LGEPTLPALENLEAVEADHPTRGVPETLGPLLRTVLPAGGLGLHGAPPEYQGVPAVHQLDVLDFSPF
jgi:hypothetical protein